MKKYLTLSLALMASGCSHAQNAVPDAGTIDKYFYEHYTTEGLEINHLTFEKRLDEWYITTYKVDGIDVKRDKAYLFFARGEYQELPPLFVPGTNGDHIPRVSGNDIINFNLQPYFGYPGWYKDVIRYRSQHPPATDSAYYSLGRAYSSMASALLSDQFGDALPKETFSLELKNDCLSPAQIRTYDSVAHLAVGCFQKVYELNPSFRTIVGPIRIKYANEMMVPYHQLFTYAPSSARSYTLPDNLYPDTLLDQCRRYLRDCPPNAILLASGDNDYYPVLYLQQHEGLRKDVYLVQIGLLALDRYIYRNQFPQFEAKGVSTGLDTALYSGYKNYYLYFNSQRQDAVISYKELLAILGSGEAQPRLPARTIMLREKSAGHSGIKAFFKGGTLDRSEWVLLAIAHNLGGRKLCTPYPIYLWASDEGLNPYFKEKNSLLILE